MFPTKYCKIPYTIILILCEVQIKSSLSVEAAPGHVFMSQGDTSFQFTIPDHTTGGHEYINNPLGLTLSEKILMMMKKGGGDISKRGGMSIAPSRQLKPPSPLKKCSSNDAGGDPALKCGSQKSIRTRQAEEFSPRLLPRPISPVGPDMVLPIPRLVFPRQTSSSGESPNFHPEHQLSNFINSPKASFRFHEENLPPRFLQHDNKFHPMKSAEIFDQIRHQAPSSFHSERVQQAFSRTPSKDDPDQVNHANFSSERPSITYAEFIRGHPKFNKKSSSSESFRNFGPGLPDQPRENSNFKIHSSHENIRTDFPNHPRQINNFHKHSSHENISTNVPNRPRQITNFQKHSSRENIPADNPNRPRQITNFPKHSSHENIPSEIPNRSRQIPNFQNHSSRENIPADIPNRSRQINNFQKHSSHENIPTGVPNHPRQITNFQKHSSHEHIPTRIPNHPRQISGFQKHSSHENTPTDFKRVDRLWKKHENFPQETNPNHNVFFQRFTKGASGETHNSKELERHKLNSNEIEQKIQKTSETRPQDIISESNTGSDQGNQTQSTPRMKVNPQEQESNSTTIANESSKDLSIGSQEIELYQKLLGYLLKKISKRSSTHKNVFANVTST